MLDESNRRILRRVRPHLLKDFHPEDAIMEMIELNICDDEHNEKFLKMSSKSQRVDEFIRIYAKRAISLDPLLHHFNNHHQPHLVELIEHALDDPLPSMDRMRMIQELPRTPNFISRSEPRRRLTRMLLNAASRESFVALVHGMIGCGKTFLIASTLRDETELIGKAFDDLIWLNDGRGDVGALLRLMLCKLSGGDEEEKLQWQTRPDMADDLLVVAVKRALLSRPNCLLVVDDVQSESVVRCLSDLKCRVLATSHNREIFNLCANELLQVELPNGYSDEEVGQVIRKRHKADEDILSTLKTIGAHPAFINILLEKTARDPSMLKQLCRQIHQWPLSNFRCTTAYQFSTMDEALCQSYDQLNEEQRRCLTCLAQFPLHIPISIRNIASSLTTGTVGMNGPDGQNEQDSVKIWCIVHELEQRHWVICSARSEEGRSFSRSEEEGRSFSHSEEEGRSFSRSEEEGRSFSRSEEEGRSLIDAGYSLHPLISKFIKNTTAFINANRSESVRDDDIEGFSCLEHQGTIGSRQ